MRPSRIYLGRRGEPGEAHWEAFKVAGSLRPATGFIRSPVAFFPLGGAAAKSIRERRIQVQTRQSG
jgi:hypothetical protein